MGNLWLKIKIWTKVILAAFLTIYVLVFVIKNGDRDARFWYWFGKDYDVKLLFLVLFAFLGDVVVTVLLATTLRTLRQIRDLRSRSRTERLEREVADMKAKASMLRTRTPTEPVHHETTPASLADVAPPIDPDEE